MVCAACKRVTGTLRLGASIEAVRRHMSHVSETPLWRFLFWCLITWYISSDALLCVLFVLPIPCSLLRYSPNTYSRRKYMRLTLVRACKTTISYILHTVHTGLCIICMSPNTTYVYIYNFMAYYFIYHMSCRLILEQCMYNTSARITTVHHRWNLIFVKIINKLVLC